MLIAIYYIAFIKFYLVFAIDVCCDAWVDSHA